MLEHKWGQSDLTFSRALRDQPGSLGPVYYGGTTGNQIGLPHRCTAVDPQQLINLGIDWQGNWAITNPNWWSRG